MDLQLVGSEFAGETIDEYTKKEREEEIQYRLPFGGGSGAGVSINPVAFLVVQNENVKLIPVSHTSAIDKLLDYVPDLIEKTNEFLKDKRDIKKIRTETILQRLKNKEDEKYKEKTKSYGNIVEDINEKINKEIEKENSNIQDE